MFPFLVAINDARLLNSWLLKSNTGQFDYNQSLNKQVNYGHYRRGIGPHDEKKIKTELFLIFQFKNKVDISRLKMKFLE